MPLLEMGAFNAYDSVRWLFILSVLLIMLGAFGLLFLRSLFASFALVLIRMCNHCIGSALYVSKRLIDASRKFMVRKMIRKVLRWRQTVAQKEQACPGCADSPFEPASNVVQGVLPKPKHAIKVGYGGAVPDVPLPPRFIVMSDEILKDTETERNSSIPWVKEATGKTAKYISKVGKEGSGEQTSYISKEDARRHQLQYEKVASAHGLVGMETYVIRVLHFLEGTTLSLMGITGRHGVGKTTLLRLLHDRLIDHSSFDYVFCIESATGCTIDIIQQGMLDVVIGPHQTFDTPMAAKVISSILKGKSFLLLVDNVREPIDMFDLGLPMPLGYRQKVIITTVSNSICTRIGCAGNTILMQCLGENDAWNLFKSEARNKFVDTHLEFKRIAKQIVQECQELPLALYTFGEALATRRDVEEWRHVCHVLEMMHPVSAEIQEVDNEKYSREYFRRMLMA